MSLLKGKGKVLLSPSAIRRLGKHRNDLLYAARLRKLFWRGVWSFILTAWIWVLLLNATADFIQWLKIFGSMLVAYAFSLFRPVEEEPRYGLEHEFAIDSDEFLPSIAGATDMTFLPGNQIRILNNGDEFYPAMLDAIEGAHRSITIEAYISIGRARSGSVSHRRWPTGRGPA
jgi:hypothetical protein